MLEKFTVGNFLSFNKNQTLSMIAGNVVKNKDRLFTADGMKLLKFGAIYGANAAGKSNLIKAMFFALKIIYQGTETIENTNKFFRLDDTNKDKTSYFEFEICLGKKSYAYGFEIMVAKQEICEEWLIELGPGKEKEIFTRNTSTGTYSYDFSLLEEAYRQRFEIYIGDVKTVKNKTFLAYIMTDKDELHAKNPKLSILKETLRWFQRLNISFPNTPITMYDCLSTEKAEGIEKAIKSFLTGITKVNVKTITQEEAFDHTPKKIREQIEKDIQNECKENHSCGLRMNVGGRLILVSIKKGDPIFKEVTFFHNNMDSVSFSLNEESEGTQRLLDLLSVLVTSKDNSVFIIDEIDRSLHPKLTVHFVKNFLEIARKKNIQLIITTHESHLLDLDILRQDEIYLVEKNKSGASILYPFDQFKERFDKKIEKAYLDGRYGGVPLFDTFFMPQESFETTEEKE
ncbi:MAG: AAA family ATPase [Sphaerochaeta sp.]